LFWRRLAVIGLSATLWRPLQGKGKRIEVLPIFQHQFASQMSTHWKRIFQPHSSLQITVVLADIQLYPMRNSQPKVACHGGFKVKQGESFHAEEIV
jgi:hypothetical protein